MLVADSRLGHRGEPAVADRLANEGSERVVLSDTDRRRSRVRTETEAGRDLGILVSRDLKDGDVLEADDGTLIVVELEAVTALVLDFQQADVSTLTGLRVGHVLGNRHWDLAIRDGTALVPLSESRERMLTLVADHLPDGVETRFEAVSPATFDDVEPTPSANDHDHSHDGSDRHSHDHDHGPSPDTQEKK
jgi:urease accessory protein